MLETVVCRVAFGLRFVRYARQLPRPPAISRRLLLPGSPLNRLKKGEAVISHRRDDKRTPTYPKSCPYARSGSSSRHITTLERQPRHNMLAAAAAPLPSTPPRISLYSFENSDASRLLLSPVSQLVTPPPGTIAATSPDLTRTESARQPVARRDLSSPGVVPHLHSPKHVLLSTLLALSLSVSPFITQSAVPRLGFHAHERPLSGVRRSDALAAWS